MRGRFLRTRRHLRLTVAVLAATTLTSLTAVTPATAQTSPHQAIPLPITTAYDVESSGDRVFVSGGETSTDVVVATATGEIVGTLPNLPGPTDLLVSNDRRTLYVALPTANAIAAFDTGSLLEISRYDTGAGDCPSSLAQTGQFLWFGYGCDQWGGNIGRINLNHQPAVVTLGVVARDFYEGPLLTAAVGNPEVLLAGQRSVSPASVYAYGVGADGNLSLVSENDWEAVGSNLIDIALDPTGTTLYTASGRPYVVQAFPLADISTPSQTFATGAYPTAVELSRDGTRVAAGADAYYDPDVFVFNADGTQVTVLELGQLLVDGGLAWSLNGNRLYAVSATPSWAGPPVPATLHVVRVPAA